MFKKRLVVAIVGVLFCCLLVASFSFVSANVGFSDSFPPPTLNPAWTVVDPTATSTFSIQSGGLMISTNSPVSGGTTYDLGPGSNRNYNAPMVLQSVTGDFTIQTEVTGNFGPNNYEAAGLIVWQGETNFIRMERWFGVDDNQQAVHMAGDQGSWEDLAYYSFGSTNQEPTYLKLSLVGTTLTGYWSVDGVTWNELYQTTFNANGQPVDVGLSIINVNGGLFQPVFSYFDITPNNLSSAPESPLLAISIPAAALGAFVVFTHKPKAPKILRAHAK